MPYGTGEWGWGLDWMETRGRRGRVLLVRGEEQERSSSRRKSFGSLVSRGRKKKAFFNGKEIQQRGGGDRERGDKNCFSHGGNKVFPYTFILVENWNWAEKGKGGFLFLFFLPLLFPRPFPFPFLSLPPSIPSDPRHLAINSKTSPPSPPLPPTPSLDYLASAAAPAAAASVSVSTLLPSRAGSKDALVQFGEKI